MKKIKNNIIYILCCIVLHIIPPFLFLLVTIPNDSNEVMQLTFGIAGAANFFITYYIRNYLQFKTKIEWYDNSLSINLFNLICTAFSTLILYGILNKMNINQETLQIILLLYFIVTYTVMYIENKKNKKSIIFKMLKNKKKENEKIKKYILLPVPFLAVWIIILAICFFYIKTTCIIGNVVMIILAIIYGKIAYKMSDYEDEYRLFQETFLYIGTIIIYSVLLVQYQNILNQFEASSMAIGIAFLDFIILYYILKYITAPIRKDFGIGTSNFGKTKPKEKSNNQVKLKYYNNGATGFSYDIGSDIHVTEYKDKDGKKTKVTTYDLTDDIEYKDIKRQ